MNQPAVVYLIVSLMFLIISLVFILFIIFHTRKMVEHKTRMAEMELAKSKQDLKDSIEIQEKERSRIGSDLHDELGPTLSAVKLKINSVTNGKSLEEPEWNQLRDMIDQTITNVRSLSHELYPNTLKTFGLNEAIQELIKRLGALTPVHFHARMDPAARTLEYDVQLSLYRIIQEFFNNSLKHSDCSEIQLELRVLPHTISLDLSDNGKGFASGQTPEEGLGLKNMRMRAEAINASFQFHAEKDKGTSLHVRRNLNPA